MFPTYVMNLSLLKPLLLSMECSRLWSYTEQKFVQFLMLKLGKFKSMVLASGEDLFVHHNHWHLEWQMSPAASGIYHWVPSWWFYFGKVTWCNLAIESMSLGVRFKIKTSHHLQFPLSVFQKMWAPHFLLQMPSFPLLPCFPAMMDSKPSGTVRQRRSFYQLCRSWCLITATGKYLIHNPTGSVTQDSKQVAKDIIKLLPLPKETLSNDSQYLELLVQRTLSTLLRSWWYVSSQLFIPSSSEV